MQPVRELAIEALREILSGGRKPREVLDRLSGGLGKRDRAFLMETSYGVLRLKDRLDWTINHFLEKPSAIRGRTRNVLRFGVYQIFHMRVPEWAAVNESVSLERSKPALVNAVLRNAIRKKESVEAEFKDMRALALDPSTPLSEKVAAISTLTSHPRWLIRRWIKRFGPEEALSLAEANNRVPPLTLRVNTLKTTREAVIDELENIGIKAEPTTASPEGIRLRGTHAFGELAGLMGKFYVQDEAAQLVGHMLVPQPGHRVLDACAAPGGKTTHIAQLMGDEGKIVAVDADEKRIHTLKENISTLGLSIVKVVHGDMTSLKGLGLFDRVLVDAPCSATGVIRRNPDVKYRHKSGNLMRFREKQAELLSAASRFLKPGGLLVYCTCSTEPEEGEFVVRDFLKSLDSLKSSGDFFNIKGVPIGDEFFRTYPHRDDMDGFFGARLPQARRMLHTGS
jgi:16S rRNA (cytosine967-C5)-methyltransferase